MKLFDLHCDTLYECCETGKHLRENDLHVNRAAAQRYEHYVQFFALFCGAYPPESQKKKRSCLLDTPKDERLARMLQTAQTEFAANADWLTLCRSACARSTQGACSSTSRICPTGGSGMYAG